MDGGASSIASDRVSDCVTPSRGIWILETPGRKGLTRALETSWSGQGNLE